MADTTEMHTESTRTKPNETLLERFDTRFPIIPGKGRVALREWLTAHSMSNVYFMSQTGGRLPTGGMSEPHMSNILSGESNPGKDLVRAFMEFIDKEEVRQRRIKEILTEIDEVWLQ